MVDAIRTEDLSRAFGDVTAVDGLELKVPQGSVFGFLGPNGAGKTTTIRLLLGLIRAHSGVTWLNGVNVAQRRKRAMQGVSAVAEGLGLYPDLTGRETLDLAARLLERSHHDVEDKIDFVGLKEAAGRRVAEYSLGMRQRLALARALLSEPSLLILDEPTNGLDPEGIASMRALIRRLPEDTGATVFVSSHLLSEVEQTATHCAVIHRGRLHA
jgi:ABC-2 type transport system ATP-binding protein